MLLSLFICLISLRNVLAACDNSKVLTFPVQDVLLSNGQSMRGIPLSAGTPSQAFSLLPQPFYNDTWLYNTTFPFCGEFGSLPLNGCITQRGGLYDGSASSSSTKPIDVYSAGGDPSDTIDVIGQDVTGSSFVKDILLLPNSTSFPGFPIGMPGLSLNTFYNTQGALGIGPNSTMLNALVAAGKIASRSYSWWWGLTGATKAVQMDGQFILGGYDAAKTQGRNYTQALAPPSKACHSGMVVTISDMVLEFPNGTSASFLTPNVLTTCILPEYPLMAYFPWVPYFNTFETLTSTSTLGHGVGDGLTFQGMLYPPDNVFEGGLTISLNDEFQLTFPNDLLVVPPESVTSNGAIFKNDSVSEILFSPTAGSDTTNYAILGRDFFQAAYLIVNYDANTSTISQANAVTDSDIVALGRDCPSPPPSNPSNKAGSHTSTAQTSTQIAHATGSQKSLNHGSKLSTGEVIGAVIGGVCALALTAIITTVFCLRRRRAPNERSHSRNGGTDSVLREAGFGVGHRDNASDARFLEAASKEVLEMQARRSQAELAARSNPAELRTDRISRPPQESSWRSPPVELA